MVAAVLHLNPRSLGRNIKWCLAPASGDRRHSLRTRIGCVARKDGSGLLRTAKDRGRDRDTGGAEELTIKGVS